MTKEMLFIEKNDIIFSFFFLKSLSGEIAGERRRGPPFRIAEMELCLSPEPKVFLL